MSPLEDIAGVQLSPPVFTGVTTPVFTGVTTPRTGSAVQMRRVRRSDSMLSNAIWLPSDENDVGAVGGWAELPQFLAGEVEPHLS